jgi:hypothetical protein
MKPFFPSQVLTNRTLTNRLTQTDVRHSLGIALCGLVWATGQSDYPMSRQRLEVPQQIAATVTVNTSRVDDTTDVSDTVVSTSPWNSTGWKGRVVVGEYLTGISCLACQPHEWAFDGLLRRYPARVFIALAYHGTENFPIADPVDSLWERMYAWYGLRGQRVDGPAGIFPRAETEWDDWVNGHSAHDIPGSGSVNIQHNLFDPMARAIDSALRTEPEAAIRVHLVATGGKLTTQVTVDSVSRKHRNLYVRILLVEDTIRLDPVLPDSLKEIRVRKDHYMVVRSAARRGRYTMGIPLHVPSGHGRLTYTFDVERLQQSHLRYYTLHEAAFPDSGKSLEGVFLDRVFAFFPNRDDWTMNPERLHVVAAVQDATTGEVLQAQMVPVPTGPAGLQLGR